MHLVQSQDFGFYTINLVHILRDYGSQSLLIDLKSTKHNNRILYLYLINSI